MGYTIKQKIEICLKSEANPQMTQSDLANWVFETYGGDRPPAQTTISRILSSKDTILGSKEEDFSLVRRRKQSNPLLRRILTEWITQAQWERIPITSPIIQLMANAIWTRLPASLKDGNGVFNLKWCNHFVKRLNVNLVGSTKAVRENMGYPLNKVWQLDEKIELKMYIRWLIAEKNYSPKDLFTIDEFPLFYCLPLDQIFDISSIDKGLKQSSSSSENILTIMLGCNLDGSEKLNPLVVSKHEKFDVSASSHPAFKSHNGAPLTSQALINKISEVYQISYKSNGNKWITSSMFQDYLLSLEHKIENVTPDRNIVIFLDNSSSHRMINLEFKHIKLVYMENASKHKNPYSGSFNGVKFDYLPMSFGIVDEFKILYRLQQYLEMINKQRINSERDGEKSPMSASSSLNLQISTDASEVLSESDYLVPFIRVIEWIKRSWDSISPEKIFLSWKRTYILSLNTPWPASEEVNQEASEILAPLMTSTQTYDAQKSYFKLKEIMKYLNVVIPWEIDDLLGLVNERSKVSLNYVSIEEIIGSCVLGKQEEENDDTFVEEAPPRFGDWMEAPELDLPRLSNIPIPKMLDNVMLVKDEDAESLTPQPPVVSPELQSPAARASLYGPASPNFQTVPNVPQLPQVGQGYKSNFTDFGALSMSMNALLLATNVSKNEKSPPKSNLMLPMPNKEVLPPMLGRIRNRQGGDYSSLPEAKRRSVSSQARTPLYVSSPSPSLMSSIVSEESLLRYSMPKSDITDTEKRVDDDLATLLRKVIDASNNNGIKLSNLALEELKFNLSNIQRRQVEGKNIM